MLRVYINIIILLLLLLIAIWLNRALAYIKLKKFRKAISDCTKVIDYSECFESGFTASRESCFKAFLRRGTAFKERKDYE